MWGGSLSAHILLTGARGFIGQALLQRLRREGVRVTGVVRGPVRPAEGLERADLTSAAEVRVLRARIAPVTCIVHAAGRSSRPRHGRAHFAPDGSENEQMIRTLADTFAPDGARFIHLSSVAVYGEWERTLPIRLGEPPNPRTAYARSKLRAEEALVQSKLTDWRILRLGPVYSPDSLSNVAVRVYLPGIKIGVRLYPEPKHTMVRLETLTSQVLAAIRTEGPATSFQHAVEQPPLTQSDLVRLLGARVVLPLPRFLFGPMLLLVRLIPGNIGAILREFVWKFTRGAVIEGP